MINENLSVRELKECDFVSIVDYFLNAEKDFLIAMGVDCSKLPEREEWMKLLADEFYQSPDKKKFFYIIWVLNNKPVGHSNINQIVFSEEAYMHLHLWDKQARKKGIGLRLLKLTLPFYFTTFRLKRLYCEPYALNPAPNKTLEKLGFDLIKQYETTPGWINFHQVVNRWCMTFEKYQALGLT